MTRWVFRKFLIHSPMYLSATSTSRMNHQKFFNFSTFSYCSLIVPVLFGLWERLLFRFCQSFVSLLRYLCIYWRCIYHEGLIIQVIKDDHSSFELSIPAIAWISYWTSVELSYYILFLLIWRFDDCGKRFLRAMAAWYIGSREKLGLF